MPQTTIFRNYTQKVENQSIEFVLNQIKSGKYKTEVEKVRVTYEKDGKEASDLLKKKLLAFTPSGTFDNGRKAESVTTYTNLVVLDFDNLSDADFKAIKLEAPIIPYSHASFVSPSGNGFKILVKVDSLVENHLAAIKQVSEYYEQALCTVIDPSGKDVSRLCFMSFDPDLFHKPDSMVFHVNIEKQETIPFLDTPKKDLPTIHNSIPQIIDWQQQFEKAIAWTDKNSSYQNGNRNNYIHLLACNCNRLGISENTALEYVIDNFDLGTNEIKSTFHSAYQNNASEFASFANSAILANSQSELTTVDEVLPNMPFFPKYIFDKLPSILKEGCNVFDDDRDKDVFLISALAIISGCIKNVYGQYRNRTFYPNLYAFIIAPAASGKGSLNYSKQLGQKIHNMYLKENEASKKEYLKELNIYKNKLKNPKFDSSDLTPPKEPPFKILFFPGNSSSSRLIQHLNDNNEQGIFCETEADTIGNTLKQDWGSYSDLLRKAFQHESVSISRKLNQEYVEIKKPRLSVSLSGTAGQVENLIKSAEDGLFSRFLFYTFKSPTVWQDVSPTINSINYDDYFEIQSERVFNFVNFLDNQSNIAFELTTVQWEKLNEFGRNSLNNLSTFISEDLSGTVKRLGLITFRISMIITALRYFDNKKGSYKFICSDDDFQIALDLITILQEHSVFMFGKLPKTANVIDPNLRKFYDALPQTFMRAEAVKIALEQFRFKERSVGNYLKKFLSINLLVKHKSGFYEKSRFIF